MHYPAVVISANEDVKAVAPEVIRRTVICRVQAGLMNTEVMKSNIVRSVQQKIGTAFYREYLRQMLDRIPDMMEQLKDDDPVCNLMHRCCRCPQSSRGDFWFKSLYCGRNAHLNNGVLFILLPKNEEAAHGEC